MPRLGGTVGAAAWGETTITVQVSSFVTELETATV